MGGLIKWLKKDGPVRTRRRESAPLQLFGRRKPERTTDDVVRDSIIRFKRYRDHERQQRLSMGANEYHSISDDAQNYFEKNAEPEQMAYQSNTGRSQTRVRSMTVTNEQQYNGHRTKKCSVQFYLNESTEDSDSTSYYRMARHSMPATAQNLISKPMRQAQTSIDSQTIREEEIEDFEQNHCGGSDSVNDDDQSAYRSPPMKFYKQNNNPYESSDTTSVNTASEPLPAQSKCPQKPKRLYLNSKQSRKFLTEAHFTGAYRNFEIQSPFYSDCSSVFSDLGRKKKRAPPPPVPARVDSIPTPRYHSITNKNGEEVLYAVPCIDMPEYQKRQQLPDCLTSDNSLLAGEVFNEDPNECHRILDEQFETSSNTSISIHELTREEVQSVMITDLDKSTESALQVNDLEVRSKTERSTSDMYSDLRVPNRVLQYQETMQCADVICLIADFESLGKMETRMDTPLHFEWGIFKSTDVTVRRYADLPVDVANEDFTLIAETAIIRDAEVLRKIRHPNIINLMAIAFEPFRRLALILEPTKYTLHHHLFAKHEHLTLTEVVTVVKNVARAVAYLQENDKCHSNISSHAILVGDDLSQVKLSSFELAVDIESEIESKYKENLQRVPSIRQSKPINHSLSSGQLMQQSKLQTSDCTSNNDASTLNNSLPLIRQIDTKFYPYCIEYRRQLSLFNYQAPELLSLTESIVFPTKQSDTYALALLLWELLNRCIPFEKYDEAELNELLKNNYPLKFLAIAEEERCQRFHEIFEHGLKREPATRIGLSKLIRKLDAIEKEIQLENAKQQTQLSCCCLTMQLNKNVQKRHDNSLDETIGKKTPDKSTSKLFSIISSPKPSPLSALSLNSAEKNVSPLNNVTNNTFYRSILDFNKLLSPGRNDDTYQRSSTLKRRKKVTTANNSKRNVRDLFAGQADNKGDEVSMTVNEFHEEPSSGRPSNEFNNALTRSAIIKELDFSTVEDENVIQPAKKKIEQPFGPKETHPNDGVENNSGYQFVIDEYELPKELIARNNKIRRCTWLSSNQFNPTSEPLTHLSSKPLTSDSSLQTPDTSLAHPTLNDSRDSGKKLNVSIKIVHKQMSPTESMLQNDTTMSNGSIMSSEDSYSVKSRIKFFRSLESQPVELRTPPKNRMNASRRSEVSYREAKKAMEKAQRNTYPSSHQPQDIRQRLLQEITDSVAAIENRLPQHILRETKTGAETNDNALNLKNLLNSGTANEDESMSIFIDGLLSESTIDEVDKHNSVRERIQKFETSGKGDFSFKKIDNKLLNEKIVNTDTRFDVPKKADKLIGKQIEVTDEKIEDVMRIVAPCEAENESGTAIVADVEQPANVIGADSQPSQTLIKRTFYQESIISGANMDMPELKSLLENSSNMNASYATTQRSSLTTRVTLRKSRRRSSDASALLQNLSHLQNDTSEMRHSISGSPLPLVVRGNSMKITSGQNLEPLSNANYMRHASSLMLSNDQLQSSMCSRTSVFNGRQIQSIEDLYIDDDYGGVSLAANMQLADSLDKINFDLISTHIFEQTSDLTTNQSNMLLGSGQEEEAIKDDN